MSELAFEAAGAGALLRADLRIEPGLRVVFSQSTAALATLVALASGAQAPQRGRVVLDGAPPATSPALRRRIAALLAFEFLPPAKDVRSAVERVLKARGDEREASTLLGALGFLARAGTKVGSLDASERRSLALGLALHHPQASLIALFEPLAATHTLEPSSIQELIAERARAGAIVLVATASQDVTAAFGGAHLEIEGGVLRPAVPQVAPRGVPCSLYVETPAPQQLIGALSTDQAVSGVFWNEQQAPELVALSGSDLDALGRVVARAASAAGVPITRVTHSAPLPGPAHAAAGGAFAPGAQLGAYAPPNAFGEPSADATPAAHPLDPQAARPPDQSVSMPTAFADPTRRGPPEET
jgi:ABC-type taurine transport system ATPase subunit